MDSVEYARGHEQLEPVRNVHAPLLRKSDAGHAALRQTCSALHGRENASFYCDETTGETIRFCWYVEPSPLHDVENGAHWILGQAKARKRVHKRQYGGPAFLHDDRCDRFGLHELMLPTHLSLKRACSLYLQPRMRDFHVR